MDVGDLYRCSFSLYSPGGSLVNATTMTLTITLPDGTTTVITPVAPISTGLYQYDYPTVQSGRHVARWVGTGTNPGAYVDVFDVISASPGYIMSLADAKEQLNITGTASDEELRVFLESATDVVERIRGQAMVRRTVTEEHEVRSGQLVLSLPPVVSLTSVKTTDGFITWDVTKLLVSPS